MSNPDFTACSTPNLLPGLGSDRDQMPFSVHTELRVGQAAQREAAASQQGFVLIPVLSYSQLLREEITALFQQEPFTQLDSFTWIGTQNHFRVLSLSQRCFLSHGNSSLLSLLCGCQHYFMSIW